LDVGCGCGFYLKGAEKFGLDCYGVEKDLEAVRFAKDFLGIEKIVNDIEQLNNLQNHFDIIHLRHVIEHISLPDNYLLKLNGLLKKDGILIIETPNSESWEHIPRLMPLEAMHRLKKTMPHCNALQRTAVSLTRPWRYVDPPRHLYGFNAYNLGLLLKKCNFQVKKTCKTMIGDKVYHPIPEKEKEDLRKAHKEAEIRLKKKSFFVYLTYQSIIKPLLDVFKLCIKFSKNGNNLSIYCQKINFSDHDW
jgi:SAM-dependent methyltransferase